MYKNILIPIAPDHGEIFSAAYDVARQLADDGAKITALTVIEAVPGFAAQYLPEGQLEKTKGSVSENLKAAIGAAENVTTEVVSGHSGQTILDYAHAKKIDCIVIASHRPGLRDFFLGSTAARVVRFFKGSVHVLR
jgi:nucleotide-binding universal stress UspA family protein